MKQLDTLMGLPHRLLEDARKAGMDTSESERSGSFFHVDGETVYSTINKAFEGQVEILDTKKALKKYEWAGEYFWGVLDKDQDEVTKAVSENYSGGYFMRVMEGADVDFPLQSCLMMSEDSITQRVHNVIICEPGSKARIISGCVTGHGVSEGSHLGVSEFYVKEGASLNFTMIHNWNENITVRPKSAAVVEDNASFVSNYICIQPVKDLKMYPRAYCVGENSKARFNNIIYLSKDSLLNAGSAVELEGVGSSGEIISRNIVRDTAKAVAPGQLMGKNRLVKAHMECRGLILNDGATVHAIPELSSTYQDVDMSHEAAVGKIADKEINYLMSRGLSRDDATSLIVRGFLDVDILGLPAHLKEEVEEIVASLTEGL